MKLLLVPLTLTLLLGIVSAEIKAPVFDREEFRNRLKNANTPEERKALREEMRNKMMKEVRGSDADFKAKVGARLDRMRAKSGSIRGRMKNAKDREERRKVAKDLKAKHIDAFPRLSKEDFMKFKETIKDLTPEERIAKKKEWLDQMRKRPVNDSAATDSTNE